MGEQEQAALEKQIREQIEAERRERDRARKQDWRNRNRDHVRQYARAYRQKRKLFGEGKNDE